MITLCSCLCRLAIQTQILFTPPPFPQELAKCRDTSPALLCVKSGENYRTESFRPLNFNLEEIFCHFILPI